MTPFIKGGKVYAKGMGKEAGGNHIYTPLTFLPRKILFCLLSLPEITTAEKTSCPCSESSNSKQTLNLPLLGTSLRLSLRLSHSLTYFSDQCYLVPVGFQYPQSFCSFGTSNWCCTGERDVGET